MNEIYYGLMVVSSPEVPSLWFERYLYNGYEQIWFLPVQMLGGLRMMVIFW